MTDQAAAVRGEIIGWIDAKLSEKKFGSVSVEIRLYEGVPVSVDFSERKLFKQTRDGCIPTV